MRHWRQPCGSLDCLSPDHLARFYGYTTGVFSSCKLQRASDETVPFRFIASNLHPDRNTLASFRKTFLMTPMGWKISAMAWDDQRPGLSIPEHYQAVED